MNELSRLTPPPGGGVKERKRVGRGQASGQVLQAGFFQRDFARQARGLRREVRVNFALTASACGTEGCVTHANDAVGDLNRGSKTLERKRSVSKRRGYQDPLRLQGAEKI